MKLKQVLELQVFEGAQVRTNSVGLNNEVESVMILEATDIETWGNRNQLILTSYFALESMSDDEMEKFFQTLYTLRIAGIVLKLERLVMTSPPKLLELCHKYVIPLIEIPGHISYESIVLSIYEPIMDYQSFLLRTYYNSNRIFSETKNQSMSYQEIVIQANKLLNKDCRLKIPEYDVDIAVGNNYIDLKNVTMKREYSTAYTKNYYCLLESHDDYCILHIRNARTDFINYSFSMLQNGDNIKESDIMILENVMDVIQREVNKEYYIKKERYIMMNNIAASILFNTASSEEELDSLLEETNLDKHPHYQAVGITKRDDSDPKKIRKLRKKLQTLFPSHIYYENRKYVILIFNFPKESDQITKEKVNAIIQSNSTHRIVITALKKRENIGELFKECLSMLNFNKRYYLNNIIQIDDLGIFRYLSEISHENEDEFIPKPLLMLYDNHPDLFLTFYTFINNNQNYTQTADELFLHPKTIRYRINRAEELMNFDIQNPIELLNYSVGAYLLTIRDERKNK